MSGNWTWGSEIALFLGGNQRMQSVWWFWGIVRKYQCIVNRWLFLWPLLKFFSTFCGDEDNLSIDEGISPWGWFWSDWSNLGRIVIPLPHCLVLRWCWRHWGHWRTCISMKQYSICILLNCRLVSGWHISSFPFTLIVWYSLMHDSHLSEWAHIWYETLYIHYL